MKLKLRYFLSFFLVAASLCGQVKPFILEKGHAGLFKGQLYVCGFTEGPKTTSLRIYRLSKDLKITDSLQIDLGKTSTDAYLMVSSDTLHNFLNIYLQKKEKKLVNILRFDKDFELAANINDVDIARLNSISDFESELFYYNDEVYTIKTQKDTSGTQFYLNKYSLKSSLKNFEYLFSWQFPFERKNINSAHIFFVNKSCLLMYVNVLGAQKSGQWILNINPKTGRLIRGTKLNEKGELNTYQFGNYTADTASKSIFLTGQKFTEAQFKQADNKLSISNAPHLLVYLIEIDSLGELVNKQDFKIPITDPKTTSKKIINNYILRVNKMSKNRDGKISFETDIFKNTDNTLVYQYANTIVFNIMQGEDGLMFEKNSVSAEPLIEKFYKVPDKLDMNGKLSVDSLKQFEKIFYKKPAFPVRQLFKTDKDGNPLWVIGKSDPKKNVFTFSYLSPVKKIYQLTPIEELSKDGNPVFINLRPDLFLLGRQIEEKVYELRGFSW